MSSVRAVAIVGMLLVASVTVGVTASASAGSAGPIENQAAAKTIDSCTVIDEPGTYRLAADIENASAGTCLEVRSDDVVIDGNGHAIDGVRNESERAGILSAFFRNDLGRWTDTAIAAGERSARSNVTVRNVRVEEWSWGIRLSDVRRGSVEKATVTETGFGVTLQSTEGVSVVDTNASGNDVWGVAALGSRGGSVTRTVASDNVLAGVYLSGAQGVQVTGLVAERNGYAGVIMDRGASGNRVVDSRLSGNELAGAYLYTAYENVIADTIAARNGLFGVLLGESAGNTLENLSLRSNGLDGLYEVNSSDNRIGRIDDGTLPFPSTGDAALGREGGYRYDTSINVTQSDGLTDDELHALVYRTIARVEYIRGLEFTGDIRVEVISREEYRQRTVAGPGESPTDAAWLDQNYEATFMIDEPTDAVEVLERDRSEGVGAYYSPVLDKLVMISDDPEQLVVAPDVLAHELTHALQDQHFGLNRTYGTEDASRAENGLVEGDATYVMKRFEYRCGAVWECVEDPTPTRSPARGERHEGVRQIVRQPYSDGPAYIHHLLEEGGWELVNEQYAEPPNSTEQVIHPNRSAERPTPMTFEDTARNGWAPYNMTGVVGDARGVGVGPNDSIRANTLGENAIYVMFWYQAVEYDIPVVDVDDHFIPNGVDDRYSYVGTPSEGWGNDLLVPYRNGERNGYVWKTTWDTERDAREFMDAYVTVLEGHGAERVGERTWVIPDGGYEDAFRVVRENRTVTIVNAPAVEGLASIRPRLAPAAAGNGTDGSASSPNPAGDAAGSRVVRPATADGR